MTKNEKDSLIALVKGNKDYHHVCLYFGNERIIRDFTIKADNCKKAEVYLLNRYASATVAVCTHYPRTE